RDAFRQGLRELGYDEGRTISVDYFFEPDAQRLQQIVNNGVRASMDVFVAADVPALQLARQATKSIPIVTPFQTDPIATGAVASLARPGGNVTGPAILEVGMAAKRVEILKTALPTVQRLGILWNMTLPDREAEFKETADAA